MRNMKKWVAIIATAAVALSTLAGCGGNGGSAAASSAANGGEKVLKFGVQMYVDGKMDTIADISQSWNATRFGVTECLFRFDDSMTAQPFLAEKMDESEDHKTFTITLKKGIKFSNGTDMTATKVKECFERGIKEGPNGTAEFGKYIPYDTVIEADDAKNTVTLKCAEPQVNMTGRLAVPQTSIVDVAGTKDFKNGVIGTGPYAVESFKDKVGYELVANKNYRSEVPYDRLSILFMGDASAKANALKSGQVDLVENITSAADLKVFKEDSNYTVDSTAGIRTGFSIMNMAEGKPLANKELRKAIVMGIDNEAICNSNTIGGLYKAGFAALPSSTDYGYDKLNNPYKFNVEAAKKILDDAGIKDNDGDGFRELNGKKITLTFVSYDNRLLNDLSDAHTQYIKDLGIDVKADYGSSEDLTKKRNAGQYDLLASNWSTIPSGDPEGFINNWVTGDSQNKCNYSNAEFDKLYKEFQAEFDMSKRKEIITKMQQILVDDAAIIVGGYYSSSMIGSKNVDGVHIYTADWTWITTDIKPAK